MSPSERAPIIPALIPDSGRIKPETAAYGQCPLCGDGRIRFYHRDTTRDYLQCGLCRLVFVPAEFFLTSAAERGYYDLHQNDPGDTGYRRFLSRLFRPLVDKLLPGARGLDFGSGPGPTLSSMFAEVGFPTEIVDPIYAPSTSVWNHRYDFVTASEVVEHLRQPMTELDRLWAVLKPGGWLGIMTKRVRDVSAFTTWHYKSDPTHVSFFSETTFDWLASHWSADLEIVGPDVVLFQKPSAE